MPRDDSPETDEYGQLVNPDEERDEDVDIDDVLEDVEKMPPEEDPTVGDITAETSSWENRVNQYQAAAEELGIEPELVYEPANGADTSTPEAFPEADVLFAEIAEHNAEAVNEEGYDVVLADAEELALSRTPDLVVFRNSAMDETRALENNSAEYVFANNWLGSASNIAEMDEYEMVGTIRQNETYFKKADSVEAGETPDDLYVFQKAD
ncbi:MAG: hypothetical protein ABEJ99_03230 [Candidatus Nanohaloarchaea archaeon]